MIDKTNSIVNTPYSEELLLIMSQDERFDKYEVNAYRPEMRYEFLEQNWDVFKALNLETDRVGYLAYSNEDGLEFTSLRTVRRRVKFKALKAS